MKLFGYEITKIDKHPLVADVWVLDRPLTFTKEESGSVTITGPGITFAAVAQPDTIIVLVSDRARNRAPRGRT